MINDENAWDAQIQAYCKINDGWMTSRHLHSCDDYDDNYGQEDFDPGWDNLDNLSVRWEDENYEDVYEHPYDFLTWVEGTFGSLEAFVEFGSSEETSIDAKEERIEIKEYIEKILPRWRFGERKAPKLRWEQKKYWYKLCWKIDKSLRKISDETIDRVKRKLEAG